MANPIPPAQTCAVNPLPRTVGSRNGLAGVGQAIAVSDAPSPGCNTTMGMVVTPFPTQGPNPSPGPGPGPGPNPGPSRGPSPTPTPTCSGPAPGAGPSPSKPVMPIPADGTGGCGCGGATGPTGTTGTTGTTPGASEAATTRSIGPPRWRASPRLRPFQLSSFRPEAAAHWGAGARSTPPTATCCFRPLPRPATRTRLFPRFLIAAPTRPPHPNWATAGAIPSNASSR